MCRVEWSEKRRNTASVATNQAAMLHWGRPWHQQRGAKWIGMKLKDAGSSFRRLLAESVAQLADFQIALMEQEIAEGWRGFYARAIWLKGNLPPPLINEQGMWFLQELVHERILSLGGHDSPDYDPMPQLQFIANEDARAGYRNYLHTGTLKTDAASSGTHAFDQVANQIVIDMVEREHRHMFFEVRRNQEAWLLEASHSAQYTPPFILYEREPQPAVRNPNFSLLEDGIYWRDYYSGGLDIAFEPEALMKPDWFMQLMAVLGADFQYSEILSTAKRLVFVRQPETDGLTWAVLIEQVGLPYFRLPPILVLIPAGLHRKFRQSDILYHDVSITHLVVKSDGPRSIETQLRYFLPRFRRMIEFYRPFVEQTAAALEG
jgi:hypothetical protein